MNTHPMSLLQLLSIIPILLITLLAGAYPFIKKWRTQSGHDFPIGSSLAAGVFLGAGLIHMLGDASSDFSHLGYDYPFALFLAGVTFLVLLWLEHLGRELYEHQGESSAGFAVLALVMLSIHSFLAGTALGLSQSVSVLSVILLAILAHKWAASFSLAIQINKSRLTMSSGLLLFLVFACMTPLGILMGNGIEHHLQHIPLLEPIFSALAAGTFIYLGTLHGLNRAIMVRRCCNLKHFSFVIIGFAIMAVVALWT